MNYLIHNTGRDVLPVTKRPRMFVPILTNGTHDARVGSSEYYECGVCKEVDLIGRMYTETLCRDCHEEEEKSKCALSKMASSYLKSVKTLSLHGQPSRDTQHTEELVILKTDGSSSPKSPSSATEFKIGDQVECLPDERMCRFDGFNDIQEIVCIRVWNGKTVVEFKSGYFWYIDAIRHVEIEPQEKDGWKEEKVNSASFKRKWRNQKYPPRSENHLVYESEHGWENEAGFIHARTYPTWHELKRKMEAFK